MNLANRHQIALSFAIFFMVIAAAPAVILSMDETADVTILFGENEEEQENLKLVFDFAFDDTLQEALSELLKKEDNYCFKTYPTPHLNLIFPPPEFI